MKSLLSTLLAFAFLSLSLAVSSAKEFNEDGISFTFDDSLKVSTKPGEIKTIIVEDGEGIQIMIQNFKDAITADALHPVMINGLTDALGESAVVLDHKKGMRQILGKMREGTLIHVTKNGVVIEVLVMNFEHAGNTFNVIAQMPIKDTEEAEKFFKQIQDSLKVGA